MSWVDDLAPLLAAPCAAIQLTRDGVRETFPDLPALCAAMLDRKADMKLSVRDSHLVWGCGADEQRATVTLELSTTFSGTLHVVESWRLLTGGVDAQGVLAAIKAVRTARRQAA